MMAKIERSKMSDYLQKNLPDGFYLEEDDDDFLYLEYKGVIIAVFSQKAVSEKSVVEKARDVEEAIKYLKKEGGERNG